MANKVTLAHLNTEIPDLTGPAYGYIRKFCNIKWVELANFEGFRTNGIQQRQRLPIVQHNKARLLYNCIVQVWGSDFMFWKALKEWNKLQKGAK